MNLKQFDRVELLSDQFIDRGLYIGAIGYIVEVYPDGNLDIEFSDEKTGNTIALIILSPSDVAPA
jgi:hypothetical protein